MEPSCRHRVLRPCVWHCDYWLQCTVWTDVDPQPPAMMTVGPGMSEKAQITGDSEEQEFKAFGTCRRK